MTSDEQDRDTGNKEVLDDEAPPEIPDISSERPPAVGLGMDAPQEELEPLEDSDVAASSPVSQKPVPPPKPRRRRMPTSPQTPIARSTPPPVSELAKEAPPLGPMRAPKTPSFAPTLVNPTISRPPPPRRPAPSEPPRPGSEPPRRVSEPPRPVSEPPRPVSEPPRPVSEPPRPASEPPRRVSEPPRPVSEPPRPAAAPERAEPASPTAEAPRAAAVPGGFSEAEPTSGTRPRPRMITIPDDAVPVKGVAAEVSAPSVMAMRIINIGEGDKEAPPEIRDEGVDVPVDVDEGVDVPVDVETEVQGAEELDEADVAPDSEEGSTLEHAVSLNPEEVADAEAVPAKPPPPPQRRGAPPPPPSESARQAARARKEKPPPSSAEVSERKPQRRPWWEEVFGEDFVRATTRDTDEQISREANFIEESLGVAPGGVVLDLGCGAGYHAVELASRGYGVVGYDLSLFQLALAADVAQERGQKLNFLQGDMREMAFEEMFDGIYCWNTTFGYFEEEKNLAVAQRVFRALRPGGMFLLDVANRDFVAMDQPSQVWYEGDSCVCMDDMSVDFITSRLRVKRTMILDDGRTRESNYSVRLYALHELGKLLHDVGFRVTEASGHLATPGVFFGTNSPRIIVLAQKP